jgi:hypothetical protein
VALLQIDGPGEVIAELRTVPDLYIIRSGTETLSPGRLRVSGYGPESLIPALEARGCAVQVLMSTEAEARFHRDVGEAVAPPPGD